ncbi:hypothetical protein K7X08_008117 [Anisodus acutangulus]|uniref:PGG domain-containing protein n=1 Tax=Anisodus acutangulus TaxID=402998 RepID=A0A9Q1MQQ1_9SOLA|nr:hypothetical protein K7X08_008117 [Anisodus acutangulus]
MDSRLREAAQNGDVNHLQSLIKEVPFLLRAVSLEVIKGRKHVMRELLVSSPDSAEEVTARGETCLHLAVKNHQFEAFKLLLENLKEFNKYDLLNKKDIQGNVVLHLAVSTKQYEVVDLLLNAILFLMAQLRASGAVSVENMQSFQQEALPQSWVVSVQDPSNEHSSREQRSERPRSRSKKLQDFFKYHKTKDCPGKVRDTLLVMAILIATATYQTVLSPPGGVWQDTFRPDENNNTSSDGKMSLRRIAGQSVMGTNNPISYGLFLVFNSIGFFVSLYMINFLTIGFPLQLELQVSLAALTITYDTVISAITPNRGISLFFFNLFHSLSSTVALHYNVVEKLLQET